MTSLTVQDGKLVVRNGALGTGQGCCCNKCSGPCDAENPCPEGCVCVNGNCVPDIGACCQCPCQYDDPTIDVTPPAPACVYEDPYMQQEVECLTTSIEAIKTALEDAGYTEVIPPGEVSLVDYEGGCYCQMIKYKENPEDSCPDGWTDYSGACQKNMFVGGSCDECTEGDQNYCMSSPEGAPMFEHDYQCHGICTYKAIKVGDYVYPVGGAIGDATVQGMCCGHIDYDNPIAVEGLGEGFCTYGSGLINIYPCIEGECDPSELVCTDGVAESKCAGEFFLGKSCSAIDCACPGINGLFYLSSSGRGGYFCSPEDTQPYLDQQNAVMSQIISWHAANGWSDLEYQPVEVTGPHELPNCACYDAATYTQYTVASCDECSGDCGVNHPSLCGTCIYYDVWPDYFAFSPNCYGTIDYDNPATVEGYEFFPCLKGECNQFP